MNNYCLIYIIANNCNNKVYVGQTWQSLLKRFSSHKASRTSIKLSNAFNKYGVDNFYIAQIAVATDQLTADFLEKFWIKVYDSIDNGYNINEGGMGARQTKETRDKISSFWKGKFGEDARSSKLTYDLADEIRKDYDLIKSSRKVAIKYNLNKDTVLDIINNIRWVRK